MNLQELATIKHNNLPIKIFSFSITIGYLLIRHTQKKNFMEGRLFGEGLKRVFGVPGSLKIANAYGIKGVRINSVKRLSQK